LNPVDERLVEALKKDDRRTVQDLVFSYDVLDSGIAVKNKAWILDSNPPPLSIASFFAAEESFSLLISHSADVSNPDLRGVSTTLVAFPSILPPPPEARDFLPCSLTTAPIRQPPTATVFSFFLQHSGPLCVFLWAVPGGQVVLCERPRIKWPEPYRRVPTALCLPIRAA
jgi:hypothetical protein